MSHSYTSNLAHCVFATHERRNVIKHEFEKRVWAFIGGIARENGMKAVAIGGVEDHVHVLLSLPGVMPVSKAMQLIKAGSSKMIRATFTPNFTWQEGFGAFSIGVSQARATVAYIHNQREHHRKIDFETEWTAILNKHGISER